MASTIPKSRNPAVFDKDSKQTTQELTLKLNQLKNQILESLERLLQDESTTDEKEMLPLMNQQETEIREWEPSLHTQESGQIESKSYTTAVDSINFVGLDEIQDKRWSLLWVLC